MAQGASKWYDVFQDINRILQKYLSDMGATYYWKYICAQFKNNPHRRETKPNLNTESFINEIASVVC